MLYYVPLLLSWCLSVLVAGFFKMEKETRKLSSDAYQEITGDKYKPYIGKQEFLPEFTFKAIFTGMVLGIIFAAANA